MSTRTLLIFAIAGSALMWTAFAQEQSLEKKDVPKAVLDAFHNSYPKATIKGYAKETDQGTVAYEIESVEGKAHRDVLYTADGSVLTTEESVVYGELPESIRDTFEKDYPKARPSICEKIVKGTTTQYELVVQSGKEKHELVYNPDGTLAEKEVK